MKTRPIENYNIVYTGKLKIPKSAMINNQSKLEEIEAMKLGNAFEIFEEKFRDTIETFVYSIKHIG